MLLMLLNKYINGFNETDTPIRYQDLNIQHCYNGFTFGIYKLFRTSSILIKPTHSFSILAIVFNSNKHYSLLAYNSHLSSLNVCALFISHSPRIFGSNIYKNCIWMIKPNPPCIFSYLSHRLMQCDFFVCICCFIL